MTIFKIICNDKFIFNICLRETIINFLLYLPFWGIMCFIMFKSFTPVYFISAISVPFLIGIFSGFMPLLSHTNNVIREKLASGIDEAIKVIFPYKRFTTTLTFKIIIDICRESVLNDKYIRILVYNKYIKVDMYKNSSYLVLRIKEDVNDLKTVQIHASPYIPMIYKKIDYGYYNNLFTIIIDNILKYDKNNIVILDSND
jgi:hypothetical protein